jgi:uncharacterized phage protein gp47/JayE
MSNFVTDTGLVLPTFAEIKENLETAYKAQFGESIDLSGEGPFGQIIDIQAKSISDAYLLAQEIYTARNVNEATGTSLDNISAETGIRRIDASETSAKDVVLYGSEGTVVLAGKKARQPDETLTYSLDGDVTITKTVARDLRLEPNDTTPGLVYQVTIDAVPVTYTVQGGDTEKEIIDGLVAEATTVDPNSFITNGGTFSNEDDTYLRIVALDFNFNGNWNTYLDLDLLGSGGDFTADEEGPNSLPVGTLTVITTPVTGWDSVNNPLNGTPGREVETDEELRIRRAASLNAGSATEEAIRAALLNEVDGVTAVSVSSNRTITTDGEGRPPKSFECVVAGSATDEDIANTIWLEMPAGIESHGDESVVITDSEGQAQTIKFTRPSDVYLHVRVKRSLYSEEEYPTDGDDAIKQAIVDWSLTEYDLGVDVIYQRIGTPVYTVEGISTIEIAVDVTANPGDTPTFASANIPIDSDQLVVADTSRISVQAL